MTAAKKQIEVVPEGQEVSTISTPMDLIQTAVASGVDADQLEKLMALQERWEANNARKAFTAAIADFQAKCPSIKKNKLMDRGPGKGVVPYADYEQIMETISPHLESAGLSVRFNTQTAEGRLKAICTVSHRDGHSEVSEFVAPIDPNMRANDTQKTGSANSYAKRYALLNALNLSTGEGAFDDDAELAGIVTIDEDEAATIREHIEALSLDQGQYIQHLAKSYGRHIRSIEDLPAEKFPAALKALQRRSEKEDIPF